MISLNRYKQLLGDLADTMSDEEILDLYWKQEHMIQLAFEVWRDRKKNAEAAED